MISDELLGSSEDHMSSAAANNRFRKRPNKSFRTFGGYNVIMLGDWWQLPPISDSAALSRPICERRRFVTPAARSLDHTETNAM